MFGMSAAELQFGVDGKFARRLRSAFAHYDLTRSSLESGYGGIPKTDILTVVNKEGISFQELAKYSGEVMSGVRKGCCPWTNAITARKVHQSITEQAWQSGNPIEDSLDIKGKDS